MKQTDLIADIMNGHDCRPRKAHNDWVGIIIHHTGIGDQSSPTPEWMKKFYGSMKSWLTTKDANILSAHYLISATGEISQLVDPKTHVSYHAGVSSYFHPIKRTPAEGWNEYAIGIELVGDGNKVPYPQEQMEALIKLTRLLMKQFPTIDPRCITGHENIAPGRKSDPGKYFNWKQFFQGIYSIQGEG